MNENVAEDYAIDEERLDRLEEIVVALSEAVATHSEKSAAPLVPWTRAGRSREEWDGLADWVDTLAQCHALVELSPCWPAHERIVLELVAARDAWYDAVIQQAKGPSTTMANWYNYVWHPLRSRLSVWDGCRHGHQPDPVITVADRAYLPTR